MGPMCRIRWRGGGDEGLRGPETTHEGGGGEHLHSREYCVSLSSSAARLRAITIYSQLSIFERLEPAQLSLSQLIWEWLSSARPILVKLCLAELS